MLFGRYRERMIQLREDLKANLAFSLNDGLTDVESEIDNTFRRLSETLDQVEEVVIKDLGTLREAIAELRADIEAADWNCGEATDESLRGAKAETYRRTLKARGYDSSEALGIRTLWPEDAELQAMFRKVEQECKVSTTA